MEFPIRKMLLAIGGAVLLMCAIKPASAATITYTVNFAASNFTAFNANPVPAPFILGQFTLTMDPSTVGGLDSSNITLGFLDPIGASSPLLFNYEAASDKLHVGALGSAGGLTLGTSDFYFRILNFTSGSPTFDVFLYSVSGPIDAYTTGFGLVHVSAVAVTPIPAALPLFISALGGLGYLGWRRRKSAAA